MEQVKPQITELLKASFRPEFLNRVDETIIFNRLDDEIGLEVTEAAQRHVAAVGFDPQYGARPLRRAIQQQVQNPLAKMLIAGELTDGSRVTVDRAPSGAGLTFHIGDGLPQLSET